MDKMYSNWLLRLALSSLLTGCAGEIGEGADAVSTAVHSLQTNQVTFSVSVRGVGSAVINALVFVNEGGTTGENVLAVHGLTGTAANYDQLASALFADKALGKRVKRLIAIDMIGHGDSGFPENLPAGTFGQLTIEDNVGVLIQSIAALGRAGLSPSTVIGHSMGGLAVQAAQQKLLNQGSSLAALGISRAILLAPVPPQGRPWVRPPSGDVTPFLVHDPVLGTYLDLPPGVGGSFVTLSGTVAPNAPTVEQTIARGYIGLEPFVTLAQLGGAPIPLPTGGSIVLPLPSVGPGAFAPNRGTLLSVISFSQDVLVPAVNLGDLYTYLTNDQQGERYLAVVAADAVHGMLISNPAVIVRQARDLF